MWGGALTLSGDASLDVDTASGKFDASVKGGKLVGTGLSVAPEDGRSTSARLKSGHLEVDGSVRLTNRAPTMTGPMVRLLDACGLDSGGLYRQGLMLKGSCDGRLIDPPWGGRLQAKGGLSVTMEKSLQDGRIALAVSGRDVALQVGGLTVNLDGPASINAQGEVGRAR